MLKRGKENYIVHSSSHQQFKMLCWFLVKIYLWYNTSLFCDQKHNYDKQSIWGYVHSSHILSLTTHDGKWYMELLDILYLKSQINQIANVIKNKKTRIIHIIFWITETNIINVTERKCPESALNWKTLFHTFAHTVNPHCNVTCIYTKTITMHFSQSTNVFRLFLFKKNTCTQINDYATMFFFIKEWNSQDLTMVPKSLQHQFSPNIRIDPVAGVDSSSNRVNLFID